MHIHMYMKRSTYMISLHLTRKPRILHGERVVFSINGVGEQELHAEEGNWICHFHSQKLTQNELKT